MKFEFGAHIGSGGFGSVDAAQRVDEDGNPMGPPLARKQLLPRWENDPDALARFRREVRFLDEMDHPNVLPVVGRNLSASPPWFVMPRGESSLAEELERGQHQDREWIVGVFADILSGMAYAHTQRRILHRDLKPENVLIVSGKPLISDFGLGKRLDPNTVDLTSTNIGMGTYAYMADEQFKNAAHVGPPADVFALGKMLGEMLTGNKPVIGRPRLDDLPAEFQSFVDRCTQFDAGDRYADAADCLAAFQLLISGAGATGSITGGELEEQLKLWERTPRGEDETIVHQIAANLIARSDNEELYYRALPRLPNQLIEQLIAMAPGDFARILDTYDSHVEGSLPFEYCDVVANFYRHIFQSVSDPEQRRVVLSRLIPLGASHDRWHVGSVVADLLVESAQDTATAEMAGEVIREHPRHARWFETYVANRDLPPAVRNAFASLDPRSDDFGC